MLATLGACISLAVQISEQASQNLPLRLHDYVGVERDAISHYPQNPTAWARVCLSLSLSLILSHHSTHHTLLCEL